jgi:hypothetical protein
MNIFNIATVSMTLLASISVMAAQRMGGITLASELKWVPETPGRPVEMVALWGSRSQGAAGVLLKVPGGWESGLHAHSSDYEAVTVSGTWIHVEEDGNVGADKELPPGSHWMQPSHAMHSDKCKPGAACVVFVYTPEKSQLIPGAKGGGAHGKPGRIVPVSEAKWAAQAPNLPQKISVLWGDRDKGAYGMLVKLPPGFDSTLHAHTGDYHGVLLSGPWLHVEESGAGADVALTPGSHVHQPGKGMHVDKCKEGSDECIFLIVQSVKADIIWPDKKK